MNKARRHKTKISIPSPKAFTDNPFQVKKKQSVVTMFSFRPVLKLLAPLVVLVPSASVVFAQQQDAENTTLMTKDDNTTDSVSLLMTNYNALREEGQGFYLEEKPFLYEKPNSVATPFVALQWWCDLDFSSEDADTNTYGYVGRAIRYFLGSTLEDIIAQGGEIPPQ